MNYSNKSVIFSFLLLWASASCLIILTDKLILTPQFFERSNEFLSLNPAQNISLYAQLQKWSCLYEGIYCLIKVILISCLINAALYLHGFKVAFKDVFQVATLCEFIFLIAAALKLYWFYLHFNQSGTLLQWHKTYLLSALSLIPDAPASWIYLLQTLNAFEILYWFALGYGISKISKQSFDSALQIVTRSYLPALVAWVLLVSFISVLLFPSQS